MFFNSVNHVLRQSGRFRRRAECAVLHIPAGASGNLRQFRGGQSAHFLPVEFAQRRKADMGNIHIQPHADRVGRDQIIDFTGLKHIDLRVSGPRAERAHNDGRAAFLPTDQFRQSVHVLHRKSDNGRTRGQPCDFLYSRVA